MIYSTSDFLFLTFEFQMSRQLIKSSFILFIGSMVANASAYLFHLALGRILSPAEYGSLGVLLSIYLIITVPVSAIQNTAAKIFSRLQDKKTSINYILQVIGPRLTKFSLIIFAVFFLFSYFTYSFFNLPDYFGLFFIGLSAICIFHLAWNRGVMQGLFDFNDLSFNYAWEGVIKLLVGVLLGYFFLRADYAALGITVSIVIAYIFSVKYIKSYENQHQPHRKQVINQTEFMNEALRMTAGTLGILFFISIDVILAKKFLTPTEAGFYTALSTLGKIAFFAPLSIATALFPFASRETDHAKRFALLRSAFILVLITVAGVAAIYFLYPQHIFDLLFAGKYGQIGPILGLMGVAVGLVGVAQLLVNYLLSQSGWLFAWALLLAGFFQIIAYLLFHADVHQFVTMTLLSAVFMVLLISWTLIKKERL